MYFRETCVIQVGKVALQLRVEINIGLCENLRIYLNSKICGGLGESVSANETLHNAKNKKSSNYY